MDASKYISELKGDFEELAFSETDEKREFWKGALYAVELISKCIESEQLHDLFELVDREGRSEQRVPASRDRKNNAGKLRVAESK